MADLVRMSIQGVLPGGEVWSVNPVWAIEPPGATVTFEDLLAALTAANSVTVPAGMLATLNGDTRVTGMRLEARNLDNTLEAVAEADRTVPQTGSGSSVHPYQTSIVASLRTATAGPRGRGRLYWPATGAALTPSTMRFTSAVQTGFRDGLKTYLSGLDTALSTVTPFSLTRPVVWSRSNAQLYNINRIFVGDIPDVQRRRRDTLVEGLAITTYP